MILPGNIPELGLLDTPNRDCGIFYPDISLLPRGQQRNILHYPDEPSINSLEVFQTIYRPIAGLAAAKGLQTKVVAKLYEQQYEHGKNAREYCLWTDLSENLPALKNGIGYAMSGVLRIGDSTYFTPTIDFEIPWTDKRLVNTAAQKLVELGLTGYLVKSGQSGHFIGDQFFPHNDYYWRMYGKLMQNLVYDEEENRETIKLAVSLGGELERARSIEECKSIASIILLSFPSIPRGCIRKGLLFDPRWIAHRVGEPSNVEDEQICINTLRVNLGYGYSELPVFDAEIREP